MSDVLETVMIQNPKSPKGVKIINKSDFDEKKHKLPTDADVKKAETVGAKDAKPQAKPAE